MSRKTITLSFLGYLGEFESDSQTVWTCTCTVKPRSVLPQVLKCSGCLDSTLGCFIRLLAVAQLV